MEKKLPWYKTVAFKLMCILLLTLLMEITFFLKLYDNFQRDTISSVRETTFSRDQQIFENFYSKIEEAEFYAQDLYNEPALYLLSDMWEYYDVLERSEKIVDIQNRMQWYRFMEWFISDMEVYLLRNSLTIHYSYWAEMNEEDQQAIDAYFENPETLTVDHGNVRIYIGNFSQGTGRDQVRAICRMTISGYKFQELLQQLSNDDMAQAAILIDGEVLMENVRDEETLRQMLEYYREGKEEERGGTFQVTGKNGEYFCSYIGDYGHRIDVLTCRSYNAVFQDIKESFYLVPLILTVNLAVFLLFLLYVRRYIRRPVQVLCSAFDKIKDGDEAVTVEASTRDEFAHLYTGFNEMSKRLSQNIRENYLAQIDLQREQLKQLQAQINPHFLYNTLLFIKIRIKRGDNEGAEHMAGLLSDYFRFMNRNRRDVIPLEEELACICTYMSIQGARFANRFQFRVEPCPEEMKKLPVPRLLLQPLVENAVKYGVERIEENGEISLYFERDKEKFSVIIEESGIEINQAEIDEMNLRVQSPPEEAEITSTININRRIKLFYGENYCLRYEKTEKGAIRTIAELNGGKTYEQMESSGS
ncbi:sensor histidine kinase [Lachnoclostridium sp. An169]|uniref:sensor histidine kinase n=1 Tax=Lachnoclostridium sp. An169 TaxID=1965569 RepID=UPI0011244E64|nr:histidine kinase [Lachnoclostridium sp. An169]